MARAPPPASRSWPARWAGGGRQRPRHPTRCRQTRAPWSLRARVHAHEGHSTFRSSKTLHIFRSDSHRSCGTEGRQAGPSRLHGGPFGPLQPHLPRGLTTSSLSRLGVTDSLAAPGSTRQGKHLGPLGPLSITGLMFPLGYNGANLTYRKARLGSIVASCKTQGIVTRHGYGLSSAPRQPLSLGNFAP